MKHALSLIIAISASLTATAQENETLIINRDETSILKASIAIGGTHTLFIGQSYELEVLASSTHDILLQYTNLEVKLVDACIKNTGPLRYIVTPIKPGECKVNVGLKIDEDRSTQLFGRSFIAVYYPTPTIYLAYRESGRVLSDLPEKCELSCSYESSYGIQESYPIKSWTAELNGITYSGEGKELTSELKEAILKSKDRSLLYFDVRLEKNQTGHWKTEAVYIIGTE